MAHHQHHGAEYEAQVSRSLQFRPTSTTLPSISEDEQVGDADEPPDPIGATFIKTNRYPLHRRESLITRSLHTDSESHDDDHHTFNTILNHIPSVSSTASTHSIRSTGDFTSDDGVASQGTRPSTPGSPRSVSNASKLDMHMKAAIPKHPAFTVADTDVKAAPAPGKTVEEQLGRKRCISFACGRKVKEDAHKQPVVTVTKPVNNAEALRPSAIKFACPFKPSKGGLSGAKRHLSPAPMMNNNSTALSKPKGHRDSDSTVKNLSPKPSSGSIRSVRRLSSRRLESSREEDEKLRFHEFASDDEPEDQIIESRPTSKHLTVDDTLQKEIVLRKLGQESEDEAVEDGEDEDDFFDSDVSDELDDGSDDGFQTDDEDGFAESDEDEDEPDSDYDWWNTRRRTSSPAMSPFAVRRPRRSSLERTSSQSSLADGSSAVTAARQPIKKRGTKAKAIPARPGTPELPDSTDFVCGTFDEDKPMEQAYKSCVKARQASKHQQCPQDIDPSFPTSDPELESEDEKNEDIKKKRDTAEDEPRGRRLDNYRKISPGISPVRRRSPPPKKLFDNSPPRVRSPPPATRLTSPPPSRRDSVANDQAANGLAFGHAFLGARREITHTASLPRSPHPMFRRRLQPTKISKLDAEDDGDETEQPGNKYTRGAVDIVQGLEQKRLKRRQKFHEKYRSKGEKKKPRKPQPGKGAQRMRQVGLDCAVFRGARVLSI